MKCFSPLNLDKGRRVPCGSCMGCRINHTRDWAVRLVHELDDWPKASFLTLTYDDRHLPEDGGLRKRDLQLFFKRLRKEGPKFAYFACGEYGDTFGRPHYHSLVYGIGLADSRLVDDCWGYGFVHHGTVTYDSCAYVAGYIQKKLTGERGRAAYGARQSPFSLQSKGIGIGYVDRYAETVADNLDITMRGRHVGVPRYYRKKLVERGYLDDDDLNRITLERAERRREELDKRGIDPVSETGWERDKRGEAFETARARESMYPRGGVK